MRWLWLSAKFQLPELNAPVIIFIEVESFSDPYNAIYYSFRKLVEKDGAHIEEWYVQKDTFGCEMYTQEQVLYWIGMPKLPCDQIKDKSQLSPLKLRKTRRAKYE